MIEIALCDDDRYLLGTLERLLYGLGEKYKLHLDIECFEYGLSLLETVRNGERFDIIYMDIQMAEMDGLETACKIRELDWNVQLVYVTAYESYMKKAFQAAPMAFIVKPVSIEEFEEVFLRMLKKLSSRDDYYRFRYMKIEYKVLLRDVIYFESIGRVIWIVEENERLKEYNKLNIVESKLARGEETFLRIHQSYLINYRHMSVIGYNRVIMNNGEELPLGRKYKKRVDGLLKDVERVK